MTETPAPLDLDALAVLERAATPAPWEAHMVQPNMAGNHQWYLHPVPRRPAGVSATGRSEDIELIAAMRNALPTLLALASTCTCATTYATYEGHEADCPVHGAVRAFNEASRELGRMKARASNYAAQRDEARQERDAAREELAKTRAELDEAKADLRISRSRCASAERIMAEDSRKLTEVRAELGNAKARISAAATVEVWTNEDGKRFVFADDVMRALDPNPEADPATTAEPAAPQYVVPTCPACGEEFTPEHPGSNERCPGCRYFNRPRRTQAEPAAS